MEQVRGKNLFQETVFVFFCEIGRYRKSSTFVFVELFASINKVVNLVGKLRPML